MSESRFDPNDPRLTAYVLGELDESERAAVERQLEECAQSREAVEEIRNLSGLLSEQLPSEPAPALTEAQRETVVAEAEKVAVTGKVTPLRRGLRWVLVTAVSTVAAAGLLLAVSPDFRSEIQSVSKYYSTTSWDEADFDDTLAFNENAEEQRAKDALSGGRHNILKGLFGVDGEVRINKERSVQLGKKADFVVDDKLKARLGQAVFETQQAGSSKQFSNKMGRTNSESIVTSDQSKQPGNFSYSVPTSNGDRFDRATVGKVTATPATSLNITNQPADPAGIPAQVIDKRRRFAGDAKAESLYERKTAAPNASDSSRSREMQLLVKPTIVQSEKELKKRIFTVKDLRFGLESKTAPGYSPTSSFVPLKIRALRGGVVGHIQIQPTSPLPPRLAGAGGDGEVAGRRAGAGYGGASEGFSAAGNENLRDPDQERQAVLGLLEGLGNESYAPIIENEFLSPLKAPLSTFGIDVDTAAYSNVRRFLNQGRLPPPNAVRIEELVNYFHYDEPQPAGDDPFSVSLEAADCPWNPGHRLVRIGLKGKEIDRSQRPGSNLVFLIDVSGSMKNANKLLLVKTALEMLTQQMTEDDRIAIVTYSNEAALKLDSTDGHNKQTILKVIRSLQAKGSTNGEAGIQLAYAKAYEHRITDGTNRVILCTDGDFNVGVSDDDELMQMVHKYADQSGVFLSIFGFGMGNLKDAKLEKLADKGNGHYGYIDNTDEAHKVFVEEMTGTLYTIAKDLKLQIEFNPYQVGAYRLIGYENRIMAAEDFDNDRKDAGDVGAGHSVTALFEIIPIDKLRQPVELKYQKVSRVKLDESDVGKKQADPNSELLTLFLRYKQPDGKKSVKREYPLSDVPNDSASDTPSENLQWSAAVASFGMVIRDSQYRGHANYDLVSELALSAQGKDESGRRKEFLELVKKAQAIQKKLPALTSTTPKKQIPQPEDPPKEETPAPLKKVEIAKNVEYWQTHQTNGNDAAKVIQVLKVLFPNMKTKSGANSGEVMILAKKSHHDKLSDLIPRMTLD